jgi:hypothetical protein
MLGRPSGYQTRPLPLIEVLEYQDRVHKDTRPKRWSQVPGTPT